MKKPLSLLLALMLLALPALSGCQRDKNDPLARYEVEEITVSVDAGEGYPLIGRITMPKKAGGSPLPAIVLIHGSGPNDKDSTIGANAPLRDLAFGLAERGVAVLRYDKRTYSHGAAMVARGGPITLDDEVFADALAAVGLLKSRDDIDKGRVFILGHSMGGGLLSHINSLGVGCAGYIIMAGTSRPLWQLSAQQNLLIADEYEQKGDKDYAEKIRLFVKNERQKASLLDLISHEDALALGGTIFGMPPAYLWQFGKIDSIGLHLSDGLPVLVLQGESDRQVTMEDFELWKEGLSSHPNAAFASYPGLNHLFGAYEGQQTAFSDMVSVEYGQKTPIPEQVIDDIAGWVNGLP